MGQLRHPPHAIAPGVFPTEGAGKRLRPGEDPGERTKRQPDGPHGDMSELQNPATFLLAEAANG